MGTFTGRSNKLTSESPAVRQTASCEPSTTTRLTILSEGSQWSWIIELDGKTYTPGIPPASGPARFNELSHAADFVVANYINARNMQPKQRRAASAVRPTNLQPSPG